MQRYVVEGGHPIRGKVTPSGNKNSALPCLAATLLTDEPVTLSNLPEIEDVHVMVRILEAIGSTVEKLGPHRYRIQTRDVKTQTIPAELAELIRASILVAGPLVARTGKVTLHSPGGDDIGRRRLDTHYLALRELGVRVEADAQIRMTANKLVGADIFLDEASVTATENAIMAASLAEGTTTLRNAASEPHVQDLCRMLEAMGAGVAGIGSNLVQIRGASRLAGCEFTLGSDVVEIGSFVGLAAATRGELEISDAPAGNLRSLEVAFGKLGIHWERSGDTILVPQNQEMRVLPDMGGMIPRIHDAPWPGFPADLLSIAVTVATQVDGTILLHEWMFESRMFFVDKLVAMGARIILCDPHRAVVSGPARLNGSELVSPDIRAGMALFIASLCAQGESTINNVYQIERGYEDLAGRLGRLGAVIRTVEA
jgi:UDP-N-acetylglucosamine 1-carboxyvinyltransferase